MRTSIIIRIICWSCVALVLLSLMIAGLAGKLLAGSLFHISIPYWGFGEEHYYRNYENAEEYTAGGGSVNAADIDNINIEWVEGGVTVIPGDTDMILFEESSPYTLNESEKLHYYVHNGSLHIQYCRPGVRLGLRNLKSKSLTLTIPKELYLNSFDVESISGSVKISAVQANAIDIETVSGSMELDGLTCESLDIEAVSGSIRMRNITAGSLDLSGVSGGVRIEESELITADIELVSGSFNIEPGANIQRLDVDTISGSIRVGIPENEGFTARYSTASGSFRCDFPVTMEGKRTAVYKDGSAIFSFSSASASINIERIS